MTNEADRVRMWINRDDSEWKGAAALWPFLERLENSFLSRPSMLAVSGLADRPVSSFIDAAVRKALDRRKYDVTLTGEKARVIISQLLSRTAIIVEFEPVSPGEMRRLFVDLVELARPTYANAHFAGHRKRFFDEHYAEHDRTFYANGLFWLNFFGPEEEERQGRGLDRNPHARVERLPEGLLLEVGSSPQEATTPDGEARLLAATAAMPPLPGKDEPEPEPEPVPVAVVDGVRGFRDAVDNSFWITRLLAPGESLDSRTVDKYRRLVGQGSPPVSGVHVLFSDLESAARSREILVQAGIRTWFVDPATGQPSEA